jgi:hypothetical protein
MEGSCIAVITCCEAADSTQPSAISVNHGAHFHPISFASLASFAVKVWLTADY